MIFFFFFFWFREFRAQYWHSCKMKQGLFLLFQNRSFFHNHPVFFIRTHPALNLFSLCLGKWSSNSHLVNTATRTPVIFSRIQCIVIKLTNGVWLDLMKLPPMYLESEQKTILDGATSVPAVLQLNWTESWHRKVHWRLILVRQIQQKMGKFWQFLQLIVF